MLRKIKTFYFIALWIYFLLQQDLLLNFTVWTLHKLPEKYQSKKRPPIKLLKKTICNVAVEPRGCTQ